MRRFTVAAVLLLPPLLLFVAGCNLFDAFYTEGEAGSLEDVLADVEAALQRGEPEKALDYLEDALAKDEYADEPELLYLHAVATTSASDISISDFLDIIQSEAEEAGGKQAAFRRAFMPSPGDTLFDVSDETLEEIFRVFDSVGADLRPIVEGVASGEIEWSKVHHFMDDAWLSYGITALVSNLMRIIAVDPLAPVFERDPHIQILSKEDGGYEIVLSEGLEEEEIKNRIGSRWDIPNAADLLDSREALWDGYRSLAGVSSPEDLPLFHLTDTTCPDPDPAPGIDTGMPLGEFLSQVHDGLVTLFEYYTDLECET